MMKKQERRQSFTLPARVKRLCRKSLKKYEERVRRQKSKAPRDAAEEYLEELRRSLDKAEGIDEIFKKHITDKNGKYIVFCSDYEHLCKMTEKVPEWFGGIDENPLANTRKSTEI